MFRTIVAAVSCITYTDYWGSIRLARTFLRPIDTLLYTTRLKRQEEIHFTYNDLCGPRPSPPAERVAKLFENEGGRNRAEFRRTGEALMSLPRIQNRPCVSALYRLRELSRSCRALRKRRAGVPTLPAYREHPLSRRAAVLPHDCSHDSSGGSC